MICNSKNFPYKCFYSAENNEIYSFYRQGHTFVLNPENTGEYRFEKITNKDLGDMVLFQGEALIARSSSSIYFFKQSVDIMTRERMGFELQRIWSASKNTVMFVTHSITEAVLLSDTVLVMTTRPGTAKAVIKIDLPRPRDIETLKDPRFVELTTIVRDNIEAQWVE